MSVVTIGPTTTIIWAGLAVAALVLIAFGAVGALVGAGIGALLGFTAETIQHDIGDVVGKPGSGKIETWAQKVKMDTSTAWVEKNFGDSYNYTEGNTIEITHGNTESHYQGNIYDYQYGGDREESKFNSKGFKTAWSKSGGGKSEEAHWDPVSGQCTSYEYKDHGHFIYSGTFPSYPKFTIQTSVSSLDASIGIHMGTKISVSGSMSLSMDFNVSAGFSMNVSRKFGGELVYNEITGKMDFHSFALKTRKAEALKAEIEELKIKKGSGVISQEDFDIGKTEIRLKDSSLNVEETFKFYP